MRKISLVLLLGLLVMSVAACQVTPAPAPTPAPALVAAVATQTPEPATPEPATAEPSATVEATVTVVVAATVVATATPASTSTVPSTATVVLTATATPGPITCVPTQPDMLGPFYTPGAPGRDRVGSGYVLSGVVRSADGCTAISNAQIEFWMAGPDGEYTDEYRATLMTDAEGRYRFESHFPPPYSGRPAHHHLRVSAQGFQPLVTQHYPVQGQKAATFDLVLLPE